MTYHSNLKVCGRVHSILTFHIPPPEFEVLFKKVKYTGHLNNTLLPLPNPTVKDCMKPFSPYYMTCYNM